jgi:hypothetical protein
VAEPRARRLDRVLPEYDHGHRHQIVVEATGDETYRAIRSTDLTASPIVRVLIALRGLGGRPLTVDALIDRGFLLLADDPPGELVLGVVGKFWLPAGGVMRLTAADFADFATPGYAKAVWSFETESANGRTLLATETRILCTSASARALFSAYWTVVGSFSALMRKSALATIKSVAEGAKSSPAADT